MTFGSVEAFHVVLVCQDTPQAGRIRTQCLPADHRDRAAGDEVVAQFCQWPGGERGDAPSEGDVRAIRQTRWRICSTSVLGRGSHPAHNRALTCNNEVMTPTAWPWPDINTTIARRILTGSFAVLVSRCSLRPSSIDNDRANTPS
jgi:hypothetical protein